MYDNKFKQFAFYNKISGGRGRLYSKGWSENVFGLNLNFMQNIN